MFILAEFKIRRLPRLHIPFFLSTRPFSFFLLLSSFSLSFFGSLFLWSSTQQQSKNGIAGTKSSLRPHREWWPAKTLRQPFCSQILLLLWFTQPSSSSQSPPSHFSTTQDFHARRFQTGLYLSRLRVNLHFFFFLFRVYRERYTIIYINFVVAVLMMQFYGIGNAIVVDWCRYIYNDRNPFEKLPDNYFCPGNCSFHFFSSFPLLTTHNCIWQEFLD